MHIEDPSDFAPFGCGTVEELQHVGDYYYYILAYIYMQLDHQIRQLYSSSRWMTWLKRWWKPTAHWRRPWRSVRAGSSAPYQSSSTTSWYSPRLNSATAASNPAAGKPKPKDRWLRVVVVCGHHWLRACPESESAARWVAKYLATRPAKLPAQQQIFFHFYI